MPREWVKQLAVCEFMHRKLASPNYMSTSVRLPVCLHCSHVKSSTYCEMFQDVASQNVACCVQPVFDSVCIFFYSFISLYYSGLVFLLPYWIFFKSQYFSTFCDWKSLLLIHIQYKSYRNCLDNLYSGASDITWRNAIILDNLHLSAHL